MAMKFEIEPSLIPAWRMFNNDNCVHGQDLM